MVNIINDVAKSSHILSGVISEEKDLSEMGSLFSIIDTSEAPDEQSINEFTISFKEKEIIERINLIIPDFHHKKINSDDIKILEKHIISDVDLSLSDKNNIINYAKLSLKNSKVKNIVLSKNTKNELTNNPINQFINKSKFVAEHPDGKKSQTIVPENIKLNNKVNPINKKDLINKEIKNYNDVSSSETKSIVKSNGMDTSFEKKMSNNTQNNEFNFIKKIKKNNHPNKIYNMNPKNKNNFLITNEVSMKVENIDLNQVNLKLSSKVPTININNVVDNNKKNNNNINSNNSNHGLNSNASIINSDTSSPYSQNTNSSLSNNGFNSVLENLLDHLDLSQKGWTSKLASRIQKSFIDGGEEIEFNLKPKNLGVLKVSLTLKDGLGKVKIVAENNFVTNTLQQNENLLQKLFNDQGINLDFITENGNKKFNSENHFNQNKNNSKEKENENENKNNDIKKQNINSELKDNDSSRHIINVIA